MISDIRLRPATPTDSDAVAACVRDAYARYAGTGMTTPAPVFDDYAAVIRDAQVWVAEDDGRIDGVLVLRETPEGFLLDNIAVSTAMRGRGLGGRLLALAEERARAAGHDSIHLYTQVGMTDNIALYERTGYREYDRRRDRDFHRVYMRKLLA